MRALPLTDKSKPGGRPRRSRAPHNPFAAWLSSCGRTAQAVADALDTSIASVYNMRNGYFRPGRKLAVAVEELTRDPETGVSQVPTSSWDQIRDRSSVRRTRTPKKAA